MRKNLRVFFLLVLMITFIPLRGKVKWEPLKTPGMISQIIGGNSINDYWLLDNRNKILHFKNGTWISYPLRKIFPDQRIRIYNPILVKKNLLVVLLVDNKWHTHLAEIKNGKITQFKYVSKTPLYRVVAAGDVLYVTGDFGLILKLDGKNWKRVPSPITSHIQAAVSDRNGTLWLGTLGQGVFSWNGRKFNKYHVPNGVSDANISEMKFYEDTLYINTSKEVVYKFSGGQFHKIDAARSPFARTEKFTSKGYYLLKNQMQEHRFIPYIYKIRAFQELPDGHALLLTQLEQLLTDRHVKENFFLDFASVFGLNGPDFSFSGISPKPGESKNSLYRITRPGIIFSDFNNDGGPDILLFNVSDRRHPFLFMNSASGHFTDLAIPMGLDDFSFNGFFSYAFDLNGDGIPEIISSDYQDGSYFLNIFSMIAGKYQKTFSYRIPPRFSISPISNVTIADVDRDGDLDIIPVYGYSLSGKGTLQFLKNDGYGNFDHVDTTFNQLFKGWNDKVTYADFDNDGRNDILVVRNWRANAIFYKEKNGKWTEKLIDSTGLEANQRKRETLAFDFDNDGDLDIFSISDYPFISVLQNNGKRSFTNITDKTGLEILNRGKEIGDISAGDFDNNGFIDLFVTTMEKDKIRNYLFLNDSGRCFIDRSGFMGVSDGKVQFAAVGDIDNDGDLDIYGYKEGKNQLWLNNLDSNNFLRVRLRGVKTNPEGIGAKIWIYESGSHGEPAKLAGYRQVGSMMTGFSTQNEMISHFGVNPKKKYDVKIEFPGGKTRFIRNVSPGKTLEVTEIGPPLSWLHTLDNEAYKLLINSEFRYYFMIVALGLAVILLSVFYGARKFQWDVRLTSIIIILNLSIFGILSIALYRTEPLIKYYVPLAVVMLGSAGPLGFFLWVKNRLDMKTEKENEYQLFQSLLNFSHGAWASSNLNSLLLFFENLSLSDLKNETYRSPFEKRKETFIDLTTPLLEDITRLLKILNKDTLAGDEIEQHKNIIVNNLKSDISKLNGNEKDNLTTAIKELKKSLSRLKIAVFAKHSCYPAKIMENLQVTLNSQIAHENIKFKVMSFLTYQDPALVESPALANILDNCIQNSIKVMAGRETKELTVKLLKGDPRIYIEVTDNGPGIPKEKFEQIFENGYSTTNSSGYGLFYSREILAKYGGRIYVKNSIPDKKTIMVIELQKGEHNEAINPDH